MKVDVILQGDVFEKLKEIPDKSVNMIVTSPPYWAKRDYGTAQWVGGDPNCNHRIDRFGNRKVTDKTSINQSSSISGEYVAVGERCPKCGALRVDNQLGLEKTPEEYIDKLVSVFEECKRVLRDDGTLWVNLGDSYSEMRWSGNGKGQPISNFKDGYRDIRPEKKSGLPNKTLVGIPFRFALEMIKKGWILRNTIIWHKCLAGDTEMFVKRSNKYLKIKLRDVKIGDKVHTLTRNQKIKEINVIKKIYVGKRKGIKIITKSGREIICSPEHKLPVKSGRYYGNFMKLNFKKASEISKKDFLWVNQNLINVLSNNVNYADYDEGFVIGFYLAEGSYIKNKVDVYKNNRYSKYARKRWREENTSRKKIVGVQFSCGLKDIENGHIDKLKTFNIRQYIYGNKVHITSRDKNMIKLIRKYVKGELCNGKHLSQNVFERSKEFLKGIIDGFLAGDGYYDKKNARWRVDIKPNENLKNDLILICRLVGYSMRFESIRNNNYGTKTMSFSIRKEQKHGLLFLDAVDKIEIIDNVDLYDIEVQPIYTTFHGKGVTSKSTKEVRKNKWNNLYFLANGIWTHNSNIMPESVKDRFTNDFEYLFFFSKKQKYYFKQQFEPLAKSSITRSQYGWFGKKLIGDNYNGMKHTDRMGERYVDINKGRNMRTVWTLPTANSRNEHIAVYPEELCETPIRAGCPEGGVVLDPFFGSGTTGVVAKKQGKHYIGIELNPDYVKIAEKRLKPYNTKSFLSF